MTTWTYTLLLAKIAGTLNRTDLTAVIPDFIALGEATMFRRLKARRQQRSATYEIDGETLGIPRDMREVRSFAITSPVSRIDYLTPDSFDALATATGTPRFYTIIGAEFLFSPVPDKAYTVRLRYRQSLENISATIRSNWLLDQHPDAYLYASMCEAAPYLRDDARLPMWRARRDQIIAEINDLDPRPTTRLRMDALATTGGHYDITRG